MVAVDRRTRIKTLKGRNNFSHTLSAFQRSAKIAASTSPSRLYTPCLFLLRFSFFFLRRLFSLPPYNMFLLSIVFNTSRRGSECQQQPRWAEHNIPAHMHLGLLLWRKTFFFFEFESLRSYGRPFWGFSASFFFSPLFSSSFSRIIKEEE